MVERLLAVGSGIGSGIGIGVAPVAGNGFDAPASTSTTAAGATAGPVVGAGEPNGALVGEIATQPVGRIRSTVGADATFAVGRPG